MKSRKASQLCILWVQSLKYVEPADGKFFEKLNKTKIFNGFLNETLGAWNTSYAD